MKPNETVAPAEPDIWTDGAVRGYASASEFCGLSRAQIKSLVDAGLVACFPIGERGDWMFARRALAQVLKERHAEYVEKQKATLLGPPPRRARPARPS